MTRQSNNFDTYYVYNDYGQLSYIIPPMGADLLNANTAFSEENIHLKNYVFVYKYDGFGNKVYKKIPGCEPIKMIYDKSRRLILSQDGNQSIKKQWIVNKYDNLGRFIYSGLLTRDLVASDTLNISNQIVTENFYQGFSGFNNTGYTCNYFSQGLKPLVVIYYDNYDFMTYMSPSVKMNLSYIQDTNYDLKMSNESPVGYTTGTRTYIFDAGQSTFLEETFYYNENGLIVQHHSTNQMMGFDKTFNKYSFTGMLLKTKHSQSTAVQTEISEITTNEYDHANRLKKVKYQIGSYPEITLSEIKYDELGRMIEKKRHDLTDIELFSYNIRNWLKQKTSGSFNEFLYYNGDVPIPGLDTYNGNIAMSGIKSGPITKSYAFTYDQLNRLTNGKGYYRTSGAYNPYGYDESFGYDKHGNINSLQRKNASTIIDYLSYTYNGNQISNVFDYTGSQNSYAIKEYNDYNHIYNNDYDFKYDANGNLTVDKDRKIVAMKFNLLNLPDTIQFSNGNQIVNKYAADGRKLGTEFFTQLAALAQPLVEGQVKKQQYSFGFVDQSGIMYINNFEYKTQNGSASLTYLNKVFNAEGYVDEFANSTSYSGFCYYRTDHLGNVCEVWRAAKPGGALAATLQKTFYFPSGLPLSYSTSPGLQPNKYNNKLQPQRYRI